MSPEKYRRGYIRLIAAFSMPDRLVVLQGMQTVEYVCPLVVGAIGSGTSIAIETGINLKLRPRVLTLLTQLSCQPAEDRQARKLAPSAIDECISCGRHQI